MDDLLTRIEYEGTGIIALLRAKSDGTVESFCGNAEQVQGLIDAYPMAPGVVRIIVPAPERPSWLRRLMARVLLNQPERDLMETVIHELLHAAYWDLDESAVAEAAQDIAKIMWRLGWRLPPPP